MRCTQVQGYEGEEYHKESTMNEYPSLLANARLMFSLAESICTLADGGWKMRIETEVDRGALTEDFASIFRIISRGLEPRPDTTRN